MAQMVWPATSCASWISGVEVGGDAEAEVAERRQLAARRAGEADHRHPLGLRRGDGGQDVGRAAGGGQREQHVARGAQRLDLAGEDAVVAIVVADRGQDRAVGGQRDRRQAGPVVVEAGDQLAGPVLRIRGAAAIAAEQQLVAGPEGGDREVDDAGDGGDGGCVLAPCAAASRRNRGWRRGFRRSCRRFRADPRDVHHPVGRQARVEEGPAAPPSRSRSSVAVAASIASRMVTSMSR